MLGQKANEILTMPTNRPQASFSSTMVEPSLNLNQITTLTLVQSISQQNRLFKMQQQYIKNQLTKLSSISQNILNENISLRSLYRQRTQDISKLIQSITLNTNQALIDYQHQQYLIKQLNCGILRQIKQISKEIALIIEEIESKQQEFQKINEQKLYLQQKIVNRLKVKLKGKFSKEIIEQKQEQQLTQVDAINQLNTEVIQLVIENKKLEDLIVQYSKSKRQFNDQQHERSEWENRVRHLKNQIKKYKQQVNNDKTNLIKSTESVKNKADKYEITTKKLNQQIKRYKKLDRKYQELTSQKSKCKEQINSIKQREHVVQATLNDIQDQKSNLIEKIKAANNRFANLQEKHREQMNAKTKSMEEAISQIKNQIRQQDYESGDQIFKLKKQRLKIQEAIEQQKNEQASLLQKIQTYQDLIQKIENPVKELLQIEIKRKIKHLK